MNAILKDLSTSALIKAVRSNLFGLFRYLERSDKAEFFEGPHCIRWHTRFPHSWFNGVLWTQKAMPDGVVIIEDTLAYFESRKVSDFTWWLEDSVPKHKWKQPLLDQGFQFTRGLPGMAVDLASLHLKAQAPADLQIKPVAGLEMLEDWEDVLIRGFQFPPAWEGDIFDLFASLGLDLPIRHYLGYLAGEPVAVSTLHLSAGVAGLYLVATSPEARKRGIGTAMTSNSLSDAYELGYRAGILHSSKKGLRVYQNLGFEKLCDMDHFIFIDQTKHSQ